MIGGLRIDGFENAANSQSANPQSANPQSANPLIR